MHGITWEAVQSDRSHDATTLVGDAWHSGQYVSGVSVTIYAPALPTDDWCVELDCDWNAPAMWAPSCAVAILAACALAQYEVENFSAEDEGE